eukprot:6208469-Amphidinium_carterae.1
MLYSLLGARLIFGQVFPTYEINPRTGINNPLPITFERARNTKEFRSVVIFRALPSQLFRRNTYTNMSMPTGIITLPPGIVAVASVPSTSSVPIRITSPTQTVSDIMAIQCVMMHGAHIY